LGFEDNVVAYRMIAGKRTNFKLKGASGQAYGAQATVTPRAWRTLRVDFKGPEFVVCFNRDMTTFTVRDETITAAGRVGMVESR
jgi:hypothetical protein